MTSSAGWITVRVHPAANRDAVAAALFQAGAQGLQELGDVFITHVASEAEAQDLAGAVARVDGDIRVELVPLPDVDWSEQWKQSIRVQHLGGLSIAPPWLADHLDAATTIVIEPG